MVLISLAAALAIVVPRISFHSLALCAGLGSFLSHGVLVVGLAWLSKVAHIIPGSHKELRIASGPDTIFTHTTVAGKSVHHRPAALVPAPHHPDWEMADSVHQELVTSEWIAESIRCSPEEAMSGGLYTFEHEFDVPFDPNEIKSAELLAIVDNWCTPTLNETPLGRQGGKIDLFGWDVLHAIQQGRNKMTFVVENNPGVSYLTENANWPEWNPYGLKYLIRIVK
jgi:hypothetical protein